ncbi:MAG: hypothetical protein E7A50_02800 [Clostridiales bacterium]|nr:hypothetical protein [Clostridiales bacterium]
MFWLKSLVTFAIIVVLVVVGVSGQNILARQRRLFFGLIIPLVYSVLAVAASVPNFKTTATVSFSVVSFAASVALFVLYALPALITWLLLVDIRSERTRKNRSRTDSRRQVRRDVTRERFEPHCPEPAASGAAGTGGQRANRRPPADRPSTGTQRPATDRQRQEQAARRPVSHAAASRQPGMGPSGRKIAPTDRRSSSSDGARMSSSAGRDRYAGIDRPQSFVDTLPRADSFRSLNKQRKNNDPHSRTDRPSSSR